MSGEFDLSNRETLRQALTNAMAARHCITVDLSAVMFIDAGVVGVLVQHAQLAAKRGVELGIIGATGQPKLMLSMITPVVPRGEDAGHQARAAAILWPLSTPPYRLMQGETYDR